MFGIRVHNNKNYICKQFLKNKHLWLKPAWKIFVTNPNLADKHSLISIGRVCVWIVDYFMPIIHKCSEMLLKGREQYWQGTQRENTSGTFQN